ncbi:uncharacterized protein MYCGRDRAFT_93582 [Zymoseptoria tritici IPO323]|uniref:DUF202 domain-containing protein n=1 Tax=Zymoseptoria tritici (strain CBS 115943 / IPO323) TaxID=336722 RepID=F9XBI7_ZYMTI|nr:uncharacterized protein MYCGRDRAFT_93582 [Zymoseptoria tritici IPO323]EGP87391.1 hypothetical protein MYCGRDRAFT_93582 [Zymoseptoria tritici IPO323]
MKHIPERRSYEASGDIPSIPEPEPAHLHSGDSSDDEREATELRDVWRPAVRRNVRPAHWYDGLQRWWKRNVYLSVPHVDCRDHLGYLRTSLALSIMGIIIAQFWRLQHAPNPNPVFGYFIVSVPLAAILQVAALCTALLGGIRFWRQQTAMARGKVWAGGWETMVIGCGVMAHIAATDVTALGAASDSIPQLHQLLHEGLSSR